MQVYLQNIYFLNFNIHTGLIMFCKGDVDYFGMDTSYQPNRPILEWDKQVKNWQICR